ncbi:MAG: hypothetical protein DRN20_06845, partial [Thermoplasmata archaeon]
GIGSGYRNFGYVVSDLIEPPVLALWGDFNAYWYGGSAPSFDVLDASNSVICGDVAVGGSIGSCATTDKIKLRANLSSAGNYDTPYLDWWFVNYTKSEPNTGRIASKRRYAYALEVNSSGCLLGWIAGQNASYCSLPSSGWKFVGMTYNKNECNLTLWLNGSAVASKALTGCPSIPATDTKLIIGEGLNATLEELMIYNVSLSQAEIYDDWIKGRK